MTRLMGPSAILDLNALLGMGRGTTWVKLEYLTVRLPSHIACFVRKADLRWDLATAGIAGLIAYFMGQGISWCRCSTGPVRKRHDTHQEWASNAMEWRGWDSRSMK